MTDLVVDLLIKILDENVALTSLAKSGVTLGPHDTAQEHSMTAIYKDTAKHSPGTALDQGVVELFEGTFAWMIMS